MSRFSIGTLESVLRSDWVDVFPRARSLGFDNVELGVRGNDYRSTELWLEGGLERLTDRAAQSKIPIASICLHTFWTYSFADPNISNRTTAKQILFHTIEACKELGAKTILVPITNPNGLPSEQARNRWAAEIHAAAPGAEAAGVRIALEVVGGSPVITCGDMQSFLSSIDSPAVGAYFDCGNTKMLGSDPVTDIKLLGDRIFQVHVKDPRQDRMPCLLGEGIVDLEGCLQALVEIDYSGPLVFETPPLDNARASAAQNLQTLRSIIEKLEPESL